MAAFARMDFIKYLFRLSIVFIKTSVDAVCEVVYECVCVGVGVFFFLVKGDTVCVYVHYKLVQCKCVRGKPVSVYCTSGFRAQFAGGTRLQHWQQSAEL